MLLKAGSRLFGLDRCGDLIRMRLIGGLLGGKAIKNPKRGRILRGIKSEQRKGNNGYLKTVLTFVQKVSGSDNAKFLHPRRI